MLPATRRGWALGLQLLGASILVLAAFLPWYSVQVMGPLAPESSTATFSFAGVLSQTTGSFGEPTSAFLTFGSYPLPATGGLYAEVLAVLIAGVALAAAAVLLAASRGRRFGRLATALGVLACLAAVAAPVAMAALQPALICEDARYFSPPFGSPSTGTPSGGPACAWEFDEGSGSWNGGYANGPQLSFVGQVAGAGGSYVWGPAIGWFLPFAAAAALTAGVVLRVGSERAASARGR